MTFDDPTGDDARRYPPGHPVQLASQRLLSNIYSLWCLCEVTRCRRAGRCVSDPSRCLDTCLPLLSRAVYAGGMRTLEAKQFGLSFDEAFARWPDELGAFNAWLQRIESCRRASRPAPPAPRR